MIQNITPVNRIDLEGHVVSLVLGYVMEIVTVKMLTMRVLIYTIVVRIALLHQLLMLSKV